MNSPASIVESPISVTAVVPVRLGGEAFRRCLRALKALDPPADEIIVVTDGDPEPSARAAREFGFRVVELAEQGGPARARNAGARTATSEWLFFIDADVVAPPDTVNKIRGIVAQSSEFVAFFGSYDDRPAEPNFLSQYRNLLHHHVHQEGREEASTFWSGCGVIRRDVFLDAGGFDESYRAPSIEDIELGWRLKRAGRRVRLVKSLQVKHLKRWDARSVVRTDFLCRALPWTMLILEGFGFPDDLNLRVAGRVSIICVFLLPLLLSAAFIHGAFGIPLGICIGLLLTLNRSVYRFFREKRGCRFAAQAVFWHWIYYFYSGLAFLVGTALFLAGKRRRRFSESS